MFHILCGLFFPFFEHNVLARLWIILFELDLARHELPVFARPVHLSGTFRFKLYELVLGHRSS